jgi:hypothetical protein
LRGATERTVRAVDTPKHTVRICVSGQIVTSLGSCPRPLKRHLLIDGEPVALCDISPLTGACFRAYLNYRIDYLRCRSAPAEFLQSLDDERATIDCNS